MSCEGVKEEKGGRGKDNGADQRVGRWEEGEGDTFCKLDMHLSRNSARCVFNSIKRAGAKLRSSFRIISMASPPTCLVNNWRMGNEGIDEKGVRTKNPEGDERRGTVSSLALRAISHSPSRPTS